MVPRFARLEFYLLVDCIILLFSETPSIQAQGAGDTEGSVRLRRGINSQSGYVEIFHDSQWGRVCDTDWDHSDAHVVCKQQGYNGAKFPAADFAEPPNPGLPIILDSLDCTGRETALANCQKGAWGQVADGCLTAKVECTPYAPQYIGCFADDTDRLLTAYSQLCDANAQDRRCDACDYTGKACDSSAMTVELCIEICCNDNDFIYAGLQAGDECYCGDATAQYAGIGRLADVLCNTRCSGNQAESCGADYKLDVYDCSSGCEAPVVDKPNLVTVPAVVQSQSTLYKTGETLSFSCDGGLQLMGAQTITCQPGGPWSDPVPNCVEPSATPSVSTPCPYPSVTPQNGQYLPVDLSYPAGSTVQLSCSAGYEASDTPTLTCQSDGSWTTEQHSCTAVDCGPVPDFPNTNPSTTMTTFGTTVTFTCDAGYDLTAGASGKRCDEAGHWTGEDPQCAGGATCGSPPFPSQGQLTPLKPSHQPDETVSFTCFAGYRINGASTVTCRDDGTWSDNVPTCELIDCGPLPSYPNVTPITAATVFATSVTFRCDDLYRFANGATPFKTCNEEGQWVGIDPVCELSVCPPLPIYYLTVRSTDVRVINTVVTFTCQTGYQLIASEPNPSKTCTADGVWEGPNPVCERTGCAPLQGYPNAIRSTEALDIGTVVTFTCREGSVNLLSPDVPTKNCTEEKQWVGTDPNCIVDRDCGTLPDYPNAIPSTSQTNLNTEVSFQCEAGYQLIGSSAVKTCTQLGWQGTNPVCQDINECNSSPCQNGGGCRNKVNAYECLCLPSFQGQSCEQELVCGPVPTFPHALVQNTTDDLGISASVTYVCEEGYEHQGGDGNLPFMTCTETLQWQGTVADCQIVSCEPPDTPPGLVVNGTEFTFNDTVTYSCENETETIEGNATLSCLASGEWSSAVPNCTVNGDIPKGASGFINIPLSLWIVLLFLLVVLILLVASFVIYRVHTRAYKKYKKENLGEDSARTNSPGVPMHGIAISDPIPNGKTNYGLSMDEEVDTGVASNGSDMQDVSLESESNYRYASNPYAESLRSGSLYQSDAAYPNGAGDSGMFPSDPESNSFGTDVAGTSGATGGPTEEAGTSEGKDEAGKTEENTEKKDKDFVDDVLDSAKEKLDNCVVQ